MAESDDLETVLDHIAYELNMLMVAGQLVAWTKPRPTGDPGPDAVLWMSWAHNAQIESHLVHVRNLFEFFYKHDQKVNASSYVDGWPKLRPDFEATFGIGHGEFWNYLSTRLSHVTVDRAQPVGWNTGKLNQNFFTVARVFESNVDTQWSRLLRTNAQLVDWD